MLKLSTINSVVIFVIFNLIFDGIYNFTKNSAFSLSVSDIVLIGLYSIASGIFLAVYQKNFY